MKIYLPEDTQDITLRQYQAYRKLTERTDLSAHDFVMRKIVIFLKCKIKDANLMEIADVDRILAKIDEALEKDHKFYNRFMIGNIEFGYIPNFDNLQSKEWFDLQHHKTEPDNLHRMMAILFRPIVNKSLDTYQIENYKGTDKYAEMMKDTPLNVANGGLGFFLTLRESLLMSSLKSTKEVETQRELLRKNILRNGGGIQHFLKWLRNDLGK